VEGARWSLNGVLWGSRAGPRRAINCKIRMLCASAGSALDELSNEMILEGKAIYKLGLGQSPFPIPQCIVDELRWVVACFDPRHTDRLLTVVALNTPGLTRTSATTCRWRDCQRCARTSRPGGPSRCT
jgi:hypothetical protein